MIRQIEHSMMYLATFSRSYYSFCALWDRLGQLDEGTGYFFPFRSICNALLCDAAISWCKVFGSNTEETHWKAVVGDEQRFRELLFRQLNVTDKEFKAYWQEMTNFRNKIVAHFDSDHFSKGITPSFELAMKSSAIAHRYLREEFPRNVNYTGPKCLDDYGRKVASLVVSKLMV
ncbi:MULTISPECIES: hypothetical protein [Marinobacter]|nr:hypothetical protein [Marinobacter sp.]MBO6809728.1 hypothetical protein [Marinobacter sp.]